jgi:hypothetical protein
MTPIERAARALGEICFEDEVGTPPLSAVLSQDELAVAVRAVIAAIREPIFEASVYLKADAEAWESGANGSAHEVYLMHSGKLRRDIAERLDKMLEEG